MATIEASSLSFDFFAGGGEMGERMRAFDWSTTDLGDPSQWPQSLRTSVSICLNSRFPIVLWWGPSLTILYNDPYIPALGQKHPYRALGRPGRECWSEIWDVVEPLLARVIQTGEANWADDLLLFINRAGYPDEAYFRFSYSAIRDESGGIGGVFTPVSETTQKVISERRLETLRKLATVGYSATDAENACGALVDELKDDPFDVPFAAVYLREASSDEPSARRVALLGVESDTPVSPVKILLKEDGTALESGLARGLTVEFDAKQMGAPVTAPWEAPPLRLLVLPVTLPGETAIPAWLLVGTSARKAFDREYRHFFDLVVQQFATALATARARETERARAKALADLDRAKTTFFSNVSHEFRTPLTLMLGPVEEVLAQEDLPARVRQPLELAHRNALRLAKLVNSLLDFSRLEAGRTQASFVPTDLAALTRELASTFRSAIERAGLQYQVECADMTEVASVDREMWEKIVLNLLSNAFKFTLNGRIVVQLAQERSHVVLDVADTGVGISDKDIPKLFERFHRVEGVRARTHEGSGIGLALANELVKLHGGSIEVQSELNRGTTFRVRIPLGTMHLPAERLLPTNYSSNTTPGAQVFVQEALRWLPDSKSEGSAATPTLGEGVATAADPRFGATFGARIIVADDNADMRAYIHNLLARTYNVETVANGLEALAAAQRERPDLILTDVMMPHLDGFGLLTRIRNDDSLQSVPVVLLSARAGEEARIEGFDAGADDYLIKPFPARELTARVGALLELAHMRRQTEEALRYRTAQFQTLLEEAPLGVYLVDSELRISEANPVARRVFNDPPELIGSDLSSLLRGIWPKELADTQVRKFRDSLASGEPFFEAEVNERRIDREVHEYYEWYVSRITLPDGRFGVVCYFRDISEHIHARQALEATDRQKDEFLAMLAHELRNPLAPIRSAGELLSRLALKDSRADAAVAIIKRQIGQLTRLVDDLMDVSRINHGRIELRRCTLELNALVNEALDTVDPLIREKRHRVVMSSGDRRVYVNGDSIRLVQCVVNILTNAAKYTEPQGEIRVDVGVRDAQGIIAITDTGAGIPSDLLPRVFDLFVQSDRTLDRSQGGLGIGLAVVRRLVEMHGGSVGVQSTGSGHGSTFEIRLPRVEPEVAHTEQREPIVTKPQRVLIVDDNVDAAEALAMTLTLDGHTTETANTGREAINRVATFHPDVVFLDIGLPEMDGYAVAQRLRSLPHLNSMRIVALSGYGNAEDRRLSKAAGFDSHLVKPVELDVLRLALRD